MYKDRSQIVSTFMPAGIIILEDKCIIIDVKIVSTFMPAGIDGSK